MPSEDREQLLGTELPNAMVGQYIGPKQVVYVNVRDEKTPGGSFVYDIEFADGTKETYTDVTIAKVVTKEPSDATTLRDSKIRETVIPQILSILLEANIKIEEVDYLCQHIVAAVNQSIRKAHFAKWEKQQHEGDMLSLHGAILEGVSKELDFSKVI